MYCTYKVLLHKLESRINDFRYASFNLYHIEHSTIVNHYKLLFRQKILPGVLANFALIILMVKYLGLLFHLFDTCLECYH